jgi:hypothetical protein
MELNLPPDQLRRLAALARERGQSIDEVVREIVENVLARSNSTGSETSAGVVSIRRALIDARSKEMSRGRLELFESIIATRREMGSPGFDVLDALREMRRDG